MKNTLNIAHERRHKGAAERRRWIGMADEKGRKAGKNGAAGRLGKFNLMCYIFSFLSLKRC